MINKKISLFTKWYIIWVGLLLWLATAFAISVNTTETQWSENDFAVWDEITQNMLLAQTLWYTCYNTSCTQKIYWKKISTSTVWLNDAAKACMDVWMELPSADQMWYFSANNNLYWLNMWTYTAHNSMSNAWSYHHTWDIYNTSISCSTPGYSCNYYNIRMPSSWSSTTTAYWYTAQYFYCVYKRWY